MGKRGWIYLKKDVNTDGTARGYKFGLTINKNRRDQDYRTENPSIEHIEHFEADDIEGAENDITIQARDLNMLLYSNSDEWIKPECIDDFMVIWNRVKLSHCLEKVREWQERERQKKKEWEADRKQWEAEEKQRYAEITKQGGPVRWAAPLAAPLPAPVPVEQTTGNQTEKNTGNQLRQAKDGMPSDLFIGLGVVLALPALVMLYYVCVAFYYAIKGIAAFWFQYGIPVAILTVGVVLCVFIYRYGMNLAAEHGEI